LASTGVEPQALPLSNGVSARAFPASSAVAAAVIIMIFIGFIIYPPD